LVTAENAFLWIAFAPRQQLWLAYFRFDHPFAINALSLVFMVAFPVFFFPSLLILHHSDGVRRGVWIGSWLQTVGALLRWLGCFASIRSYALVFVGQTLAAISQIFILGKRKIHKLQVSTC
jgi:hypothetical protein